MRSFLHRYAMTLLLGLASTALFGATYSMFSPGGALSGTWNSQNVNVGAGGSFITGTLPAGNGGTGSTTATDDAALVGNGTIFAPAAVPNCGDSTHALAYATGSNAFSCQSVTGTGTAQTSSTFTVTWVTGCSNDPTGDFTYVQTGNIVTLQMTSAVSCTSDATSKQTATGALPAAIRPTRTQSLKTTDVSIASADTEMCLTLQPDGQIQMHTGIGCGTNPGNNNMAVVVANQTALSYLLN
jgi:hypothetical protein